MFRFLPLALADLASVGLAWVGLLGLLGEELLNPSTQTDGISEAGSLRRRQTSSLLRSVNAFYHRLPYHYIR